MALPRTMATIILLIVVPCVVSVKDEDDVQEIESLQDYDLSQIEAGLEERRASAQGIEEHSTEATLGNKKGTQDEPNNTAQPEQEVTDDQSRKNPQGPKPVAQEPLPRATLPKKQKSEDDVALAQAKKQMALAKAAQLGATKGRTKLQCGDIVPGSQGRLFRSSCKCPDGQRLMLPIGSTPNVDIFCNGKKRFTPDPLIGRGCLCRVPEAFVCPDQCWQCCKSSQFSMESPKFKCILKAQGELPGNRDCSTPQSRSYDDNTYKTHCSATSWERPSLPDDKCETKSDFRKQVDWGLEKLQEVPTLLFSGGSNLAEMGKIIKYIHSRAEVRKRYLPLSQLMMIHPVDTEAAVTKTAKRARVMRENVAVIQERGLKFSEDLANNHPAFKIMTSKEGFEVTKVASNPDRYVIMEGNGRLCATRWAFPDNDEYREIRNTLQIEVNEHILEGNQKTKAVDRITALRASYLTDDYETLFPPSIDEETVLAYIEEKWKAGVGLTTFGKPASHFKNEQTQR